MTFYVYLTASARNGTTYVGQTDNLPRRINEHKTYAFPDCFTARYHVTQLVYFEEHATRAESKKREKSVKKWSRQRKLKLIENKNPEWTDLAADWHTGETHYSYQASPKLHESSFDEVPPPSARTQH